MRAGVDRKTARKYMSGGKLPSELVEPRDWKTREDPFVEHWPEVEALLSESPGLAAKTLFELLVGKYEGRYDEGQLRTLQRRVKTWRAERGPEKDVVLGQQHRPGEAAQTDFTWTREFAVTIAGQVFAHMLAFSVRSFSPDACPSGVRRTTPPRQRTGSRTPRAPSPTEAPSVRSMTTISRSCDTSA